MSTRIAGISVILFFVAIIIGGFVALALLGGTYLLVSISSISLFVLGLIISGIYMYSSRKIQAPEPMVDSTTSSVYYEEAKPEAVESETPMILCPDCGYENPRDAEFCIRCGRDLDVTDDVARY